MDGQMLNEIISGIIAGNRKRYNPTYFYGTHERIEDVLCSFIQEYIEKTHSGKNILWTSAEDFTMELVYAIKDNTMESFRKKYHGCDLLILDRFERIAWKKSVMKEFYEIFDELYQNSRQIILAGSVQPKRIEGLEGRVRSILENGMIYHVE